MPKTKYCNKIYSVFSNSILISCIWSGILSHLDITSFIPIFEAYNNIINPIITGSNSFYKREIIIKVGIIFCIK